MRCTVSLDACCLFLVSLRSRPGSPLFPYTTLFRSDVEGDTYGLHPDPRGGMLQHGDDRRERGRVPDFPERIDRKSTRLNSSHITPSYAVFCLTKNYSRPSYADPMWVKHISSLDFLT